jgi:hypothetical protein
MTMHVTRYRVMDASQQVVGYFFVQDGRVSAADPALHRVVMRMPEGLLMREAMVRLRAVGWTALRVDPI